MTFPKTIDIDVTEPGDVIHYMTRMGLQAKENKRTPNPAVYVTVKNRIELKKLINWMEQEEYDMAAYPELFESVKTKKKLVEREYKPGESVEWRVMLADPENGPEFDSEDIEHGKVIKDLGSEILVQTWSGQGSKAAQRKIKKSWLEEFKKPKKKITEGLDSLLIKALTNDLGWSIGQQFDYSLHGQSLDEQNTNALKHISEWLHDNEGHIKFPENVKTYLEELDEYLNEGTKMRDNRLLELAGIKVIMEVEVNYNKFMASHGNKPKPSQVGSWAFLFDLADYNKNDYLDYVFWVNNASFTDALKKATAEAKKQGKDSVIVLP